MIKFLFSVGDWAVSRGQVDPYVPLAILFRPYVFAR